MFNSMMRKVTEAILNKDSSGADYDTACQLALFSDEYTVDLLTCARKITQANRKNRIFTCSIINAKSGFCSQDCAFCAQSSFHKTGIAQYPLMEEDALVKQAAKMKAAGARKFSFVTSGHMLKSLEVDRLCRAAERIRSEVGISVCASLGMMTPEMAERYRNSGITRYHHNLETARSYFDQICTTHAYNEDIETIRIAKAAGMQVCSGGIMGLGESWEQRVELAITLKELDVDCIPINFLNPIPGTPLQHRPLLSPMEALKCIAIFRFVNPGKEITICGGREVTLKELQSWVFQAGASGLMVGNYLTTLGRSIESDMEMIQDLGLVVEP